MHIYIHIFLYLELLKMESKYHALSKSKKYWKYCFVP